jgi:hypothetical protein
MRQKRKLDSRGSSVKSAIRWPGSDMKSWPALLIGSIVSKASGKERYALVMSAYFSSLRRVVASAAEAVFAGDWVTYDAAYYYLAAGSGTGAEHCGITEMGLSAEGLFAAHVLTLSDF